MDFYEKLSQYYDVLFPPSLAQIEFLKTWVSAGEMVLDIGAGTGGYAAQIAKEGCFVDALEIGSMVPHLKQKAQEEQFNALELDMRHVEEVKKTYDFIYCIGNTLVHLKDFEELLMVLKAFNKVLAKTGKLAIQIVNYDRIAMQNIRELPVIHRENMILKRHYEIGKKGVLFRTELKVENQSWEAQTMLLLLKKRCIEELLLQAGFSKTTFYGNFEKLPWSEDSIATIAIAYK